MRDLMLGVLGNLLAAAVLSAAAVVDLRVLTPDPYFAAGVLAVAIAVLPFAVALRVGAFMSFGDSARAALLSHLVYLAWLVTLGAVQILVPFIVAQRYASGAWCAPNLGNALFMPSLGLFVLTSVLAGELRVLRAVGSYATWQSGQVRSALQAVILFGTPLVLSAFALFQLGLVVIPGFAASFPSRIGCP
jgi:hypothetical protein